MDSPEGVKIFRTEIVAQDMIMLNKRDDGEGGDDYYPDHNDSSYSDDMFDPDMDLSGSDEKAA